MRMYLEVSRSITNLTETHNPALKRTAAPPLSFALGVFIMSAEREEIANEVWHDIPPQSERAKMSPEQLSILLSSCEKDSPKYTLLSHELNMRIAKEQSKATLEAGRYSGNAAILAALLTLILGYLLGSSQSNELQNAKTCPSSTCTCSYPVTPLSSAKIEHHATKNTNGKVNPKP